jgi:hypothetical protein
VEVSLVRNRLRQAIGAAREGARRRRQHTAESARAFEEFLNNVATPLTRLVGIALKAEGYAFTVFTPAGGLRLADDRGRDDYIELVLDTEPEPAQVVGRIRYTRGSRTLTDERPLRPGAAPDALSEEDVLSFLLDALTPWIER